jgi:hypothetical protein
MAKAKYNHLAINVTLDQKNKLFSLFTPDFQELFGHIFVGLRLRANKWELPEDILNINRDDNLLIISFTQQKYYDCAHSLMVSICCALGKDTYHVQGCNDPFKVSAIPMWWRWPSLKLTLPQIIKRRFSEYYYYQLDNKLRILDVILHAMFPDDKRG